MPGDKEPGSNSKTPEPTDAILREAIFNIKQDALLITVLCNTLSEEGLSNENKNLLMETNRRLKELVDNIKTILV